MIITTTDSVEGRVITKYHGIVAGEAVMGTNLFSDFFASIRDVVGGRSGSYQKLLKAAKEAAIEDLTEEARSFGADAVVGIDLDYEVVGGDKKTMLIVSANGTAVKLA
ncbi:MAG: heavy metal-binding domain-containing protein [Rhodospirillales bacterium]